jgi:hypothetical protein
MLLCSISTSLTTKSYLFKELLLYTALSLNKDQKENSVKARRKKSDKRRGKRKTKAPSDFNNGKIIKSSLIKFSDEENEEEEIKLLDSVKKTSETLKSEIKPALTRCKLTYNVDNVTVILY